jgi:hypothetical protein
MNWTKEDDDRIREMAAKGASTMRIAVAIKRKASAVRLRARILGCPLPTLLDRRRIMRQKIRPPDNGG